MQRKSTNKELVELLEQRNEAGRYDKMIQKAKAYWYHDFKAPEEASGAPKLELLQDLSEFAELHDIRQMVMDDEFEESPDEEDKSDMRRHLPNSMWGMMGLNPWYEEQYGPDRVVVNLGLLTRGVAVIHKEFGACTVDDIIYDKTDGKFIGIVLNPQGSILIAPNKEGVFESVKPCETDCNMMIYAKEEDSNGTDKDKGQTVQANP